MKQLLLILAFSWLTMALHAQYVYTINADSVKITNHCDTAELIIENHTQNVPGFLFNKGRGRTEFRRAVQRLNPGTYLIGGDTLYTYPNAWVQGGNTFGATGILGTLDSNHLDLYTNNARRLRLTSTGNLLLGSTADNGARLQVNGKGGIYTDPGADSGTGIGHLFLNGGGTTSIIGTYGHDMILKLPSVAETFRFQFGGGPHLYESASDFNIIGNNGGNITLACSNKYLDINNVQNILTDASSLNLTVSNYNGGDGVVIKRGPRSTIKEEPILSLRDSITDVFKVLRTGAQFITGNVAALNPVHTIFNPVISQTAGVPDFGSLTGIRVAPTLNVHGTYQQAYAMDISPTYNLNGFEQHTDGISPALHVNAALGGVRIDQQISYAGNSGQPLHIYQASGADKSAILNYRNASPTVQGFVWNRDNRPSLTCGSVIPAVRSTVTTAIVAGGGVSFTLDRYYYGTEASIDMKYLLTPAGDTASTLKTAIAFNTVDLGYRSAALYINGSRIGIGTITPEAQLHTTGSVRFAGLAADTSLTRVLVSDAGGNLYYRNLSAWSGGSAFNADMTIKGALTAQKVNIRPGAWADYVFDKNYRLPALSEVESYIRQNNHLPGIPSAAEVQQNGIEVGESHTALLKKVEELTLYVIEQEKRNKQQSDEIKALKEQMNELMRRVNK